MALQVATLTVDLGQLTRKGLARIKGAVALCLVAGSAEGDVFFSYAPGLTIEFRDCLEANGARDYERTDICMAEQRTLWEAGIHLAIADLATMGMPDVDFAALETDLESYRNMICGLEIAARPSAAGSAAVETECHAELAASQAERLERMVAIQMQDSSE